MEDSRFIEAAELARSGSKTEALVLFQALVRDHPADERFWLGLAACLPTRELREQALMTCLRINPGAERARIALDALRAGHLKAFPAVDQPMIAITGSDRSEAVEQPAEDAWALSGGARVFTVSPEEISPDEVAEREARVYDLLPYRLEFVDMSNPWEELEETGDRLTQTPITQRRRFTEQMQLSPSEQERQLGLAYSTLAVLVVALLLILLIGMGSFGY